MVWVNGEQIRQAGILRQYKFDILRVVREARRVWVLVYLGGGFGKVRWCELKGNL
jgi:hypothetical protein